MPGYAWLDARTHDTRGVGVHVRFSTGKGSWSAEKVAYIQRATSAARLRERQDRLRDRRSPFGYMAFYPGPGLGGHCIPIDPFYLTWKAREHGINTRFIELAGEINADIVFIVA
jgi:hypothetical protein